MSYYDEYDEYEEYDEVAEESRIVAMSFCEPRS